MTKKASKFTDDFKKKVDLFLLELRAKQAMYYAEHYAVLNPPTFTAEYGSKYVRIVESKFGDQRSVFCFLDGDGNILKAASWAAPAKHNRGTIHTPTTGMEFLSSTGPAYLPPGKPAKAR